MRASTKSRRPARSPGPSAGYWVYEAKASRLIPDGKITVTQVGRHFVAVATTPSGAEVGVGRGRSRKAALMLLVASLEEDVRVREERRAMAAARRRDPVRSWAQRAYRAEVAQERHESQEESRMARKMSRLPRRRTTKKSRPKKRTRR